MRKRKLPRATKAELAYIQDMRRTSAFDLVDQGKAKILSPSEYPEPIKRFLARERRMVHIQLPISLKSKLEQRSRRRGVPAEKLARIWIEEKLRRTAG